LQQGSPVRYEAFRSLRIALHGSGMLVDSGAVIMVTSSTEHEGKTSTVGGLAVTIAASGREVVVLEADMYRPRLASFFDVAAGPGLVEVLDGDLSLDDALEQTELKRLRVLRAGSRTRESNELLESPKLKDLLNELKTSGAVVLIDTPPLLALSDAAVLAQQADYVLLVVGALTATERDVTSAVAVLRQVQVGLAGVIVNMLPRSWSDSNARAHESYLPSAADSSR
jgi:capsular exopolysaccharide synthesis family protein